MRWSTVFVFAFALLLSGLLTAAVSAYLFVHMSRFGTPAYFALNYVLFALTFFAVAFVFSRRIASRPYHVALVAFVLSEVAAMIPSFVIMGHAAFSPAWFLDTAWAGGFLFLGTAFGQMHQSQVRA